MRYVGIFVFAIVTAALLAFLLFAIFGQRQTGTTVGLPTPTVAATLASSPTPPPTPSGLYVNATYKFSVVLPEPYRKSARLSIANFGGQRPAAADAFTARAEADEESVAGTRCETACPIWNYVAVIDVFTATGTQTPRDFYNASSFSRDQKIEDVIVDGHQAVRVTNAPSYPVEYVVKDGDRMFTIAYQTYPYFDVPAGASVAKLEAILTSFKFVP